MERTHALPKKGNKKEILILIERMLKILPEGDKNQLLRKFSKVKTVEPLVPIDLNTHVKRLIPVCQARNKRVYFDKNTLNLTTSPTTFRLFQCFTEAKEEKISKIDLIKNIYSMNTFEDKSARYVNAMKHRVIKLVSRSRKLAETHLTSDKEKLIQWFPYDKQVEGWCLYQIRKEYFNRLDPCVRREKPRSQFLKTKE